MSRMSLLNQDPRRDVGAVDVSDQSLPLSSKKYPKIPNRPHKKVQKLQGAFLRRRNFECSSNNRLA